MKFTWQHRELYIAGNRNIHYVEDNVTTMGDLLEWKSLYQYIIKINLNDL